MSSQGFPQSPTAAFVDQGGFITQPWRYFLQTIWQRTGGATDNIQSQTLTGEVRAYAGTSAPTGWLLCDGSIVSRTTYATLFGVIGTLYGAGDGATTFALPDFRGRIIVGAGTGTGLTPRTLGNTGGAETAALAVTNLPAHDHPVTDPGHAHTITDPGHAHTASATATNATSGSSAGAAAGNTGTATTGITINSATTGVTVGDTGDGTPFSVMPPFGVLSYIIKY